MARQALVLISAIVPIIGILYLVSSFFDGAHDGRIAGNEAYAMASTLGACGLLLTIVARRWLVLYPLSVAFILAGLIYLVAGAIGGNGRWAIPGYRYAGYLVVSGSVALATVIGRRQDPEGNYRFIGWCAAAAMYIILRFEVLRWFEPLHYHPMGTFVPADVIRQQSLTTWVWTGGLWAVWSFVLVWMRARGTNGLTERKAA